MGSNINRWTDQEIMILKENYGQIPLPDIDIPGRSYQAKRTRARILGLYSALKGQGKRQYSCNDNYFNVPNLENSYWAGFIAADGCIIKNRNCLQILLSTKDLQHLKLFARLIEFNGPIKFDNYGMAILRIYSKQICHDLKNNFNIITNKTLILKPPPLNGNFALAFIKGYIDGDGWISIAKIQNKYSYLTIGFIGTRQVLRWIKNTLSQYIGQKLINKIFKRKNNQCYQFSIMGSNATAIYQHLEPIINIGLNRKWSKYV